MNPISTSTLGMSAAFSTTKPAWRAGFCSNVTSPPNAPTRPRAIRAEPVRVSWYALVGPALVINYFGQGAMLLELGKPVDQPLYHLVPAVFLPWLVILATAATVIASQATISGAFSMARQAVHLDLLPRLRVLQTSALEPGQVYVPIVNWLVFIAVCAFVVGFGSSDALSGAYGAAVVGTMMPAL